ncbi:MAG: PD40 domain-containing protein [Anaerolineales bacterium]|nr:PD40 domain-containing protein [Anaerolineales bacterium]
MRKLGAIIVVVYLAACSSGGAGTPTSTADIPQASTPISTQTSIPSTDTPTLAPTDTPTPAPTAIGGGAGKIAFTSEWNGSSEIYVVNADGSGLSPLASEIAPKFNPAWSPDGSKIAFGTSDGDTASIYIMNADGSSPVKLIDTTEISVYDPANMDLRFNVRCCSTTWSPDGSKIRFRITHYIGCCAQHGNNYVINADGSNLIHITGYESFTDPSWSPDSQRIVFEGNCRDEAICVMDADGTNLTKLIQKNKAAGPIWSSDGKKIAFTTGWGGHSEIYVMNADGTELTRVSYTVSPWDQNPVWSPDSQKIAFLSYRDGNYEIYTVNADGSDLVNLTNSADG